MVNPNEVSALYIFLNAFEIPKMVFIPRDLAVDLYRVIWTQDGFLRGCLVENEEVGSEELLE